MDSNPGPHDHQPNTLTTRLPTAAAESLTSAKRGETLTPNPNECNSTLTTNEWNQEYLPPPRDVNDRGHRLRIISALR